MKYSLFWDVTQRRLVVTDVSGQPIRPIFKGQILPAECLTLLDGTDMLSRKVEKKQELRNIREEGTSRFVVAHHVTPQLVWMVLNLNYSAFGCRQ